MGDEMTEFIEDIRKRARALGPGCAMPWRTLASVDNDLDGFRDYLDHRGVSKHCASRWGGGVQIWLRNTREREGFLVAARDRQYVYVTICDLRRRYLKYPPLESRPGSDVGTDHSRGGELQSSVPQIEIPRRSRIFLGHA